MKKKKALIVFAKAPVPGKVKTRLIPALNRYQATRIYKQLLDRTIKLAIKSKFDSIYIWVDGNLSNPYFRAIKNRYGIKFYIQSGRCLGDRMFNSFKFVLRNHSYAVLIGCDCPGLTHGDLDAASCYMEQDTDVVLGPANDGGYYLIGLKKNNYRIFENIKWGNHSVIKETLTRIEALQWKYSKLQMHADIDNARDLRACLNLF